MIKSKRMTWKRHVERMVKMRNAHSVLVRKPEGKRPFGRPRLRREDNITMVLRKLGLECVDWMYLAQDRDQRRALVITVTLYS
jgi:hypothetical protein